MESYSLNTSGLYLNSRLSLIGGIRRDFYSTDYSNVTFTSGRPDGGLSVGKGKAAPVTTGSVGSVYFPVPALGVFVNYSTGFNPSAAVNPNINGDFVASTTQSRAYAGGLRLNFNRKLVGSISYYDQVEAGAVAGSPGGISAGIIQSIWRLIGRSTDGILGGTALNFVDTSDTSAKGYEIDLTANFTTNARLKFNVAFPTATRSNVFTTTRAYIAANLPTWQTGSAALRAAGNIADANAVDSSLATVNGLAAAFLNNRSQEGRLKYTANVYGSYQFSQSGLKGMRLGGGVRFVGQRQIGNAINQPYQYVYAGAYHLVSAMIGYDLRVRNVPVGLQLNIDNLLDYDRPVYDTVAVYQNVAFRNGFSYREPRKVTFTGTLRF